MSPTGDNTSLTTVPLFGKYLSLKRLRLRITADSLSCGLLPAMTSCVIKLIRHSNMYQSSERSSAFPHLYYTSLLLAVVAHCGYCSPAMCSWTDQQRANSNRNTKQTRFLKVFIVNKDIEKKRIFAPNNTYFLLIVILSRLFMWQKNGTCNRWEYVAPYKAVMKKSEHT